MPIKVYNHRGPQNNEVFEYLSDALIQIPFANNIFELTRSLDEADLIPLRIQDTEFSNETVLKILSNFPSSKCIIEMTEVLGASEESTSYKKLNETAKRIESILNNTLPAFIILHNNGVSHPNYHDTSPVLQYTNFMFNRHVSFYVDKASKLFDYGSDGEIGHWYPHHNGMIPKEAFELLDIDSLLDYAKKLINNPKREIIPKTFIYSAMIRDAAKLNQSKTVFANCEDFNYSQIIEIRNFLRNELYNKLKDYIGHIGNPAFGNFLMLQNGSNHHLKLSNKLQNFNTGFWPLDNSYYESSVLTVLVETLTISGDYHLASEKTFEPLIKGNFIIPFAYAGYIEHLTNLGFKFPNWIDYNYDKEKNDLLRWSQFLNNAVIPTLNMNPIELFRKKIEDKDILLHNRNVFFQGYQNTILDAINRWCDHDHSKQFIVRERFC